MSDSWYRPLLKPNGDILIVHMSYNDFDHEYDGHFLSDERFDNELDATNWTCAQLMLWSSARTVEFGGSKINASSFHCATVPR